MSKSTPAAAENMEHFLAASAPFRALRPADAFALSVARALFSSSDAPPVDEEARRKARNLEVVLQERPLLMPGFRHVVTMPGRIGGKVGLIASRLGVGDVVGSWWEFAEDDDAAGFVKNAQESFGANAAEIAEAVAFAALFPDALSFAPHSGDAYYEFWRKDAAFRQTLAAMGYIPWVVDERDARSYYERVFAAGGSAG